MTLHITFNGVVWGRVPRISTKDSLTGVEKGDMATKPNAFPLHPKGESFMIL